ncbi:hypothetical protein HII13_005260 [Brettanomyces bruxellensis]|uniref:Glucose-induced degradation protein 4 n=2 Tax=Dekkera bruxellensis TaxID=5007 RepID=A0A8H6B7H0_DEKBR|nr:uncharacterized protein BRETT_002987 [Brettanomyces bruxellensis]KAF6006139.1 hypothetical protein HII13_005260 [Brettanomyces bruxellensis]QOU22801.1 hypothetical protein BRETT_002987 [Brettanomyces bruxellensis]
MPAQSWKRGSDETALTISSKSMKTFELATGKDDKISGGSGSNNIKSVDDRNGKKHESIPVDLRTQNIKQGTKLLFPKFPDPLMNRELLITTSFLRPHSGFVGTQQSGRLAYDVQVDLKEVNLEKSFLTGFLTIHGLTEAHPEITTFFRGEIVGPKFSFYTKHPEWGSTKKNDIQHWGRFPSWRKLNFNTDDDAENHQIYKEAKQGEFLYMRWKELFLVPDARIKNIKGASFTGFYYISFNQLTGSISGLYFHKSSDKFQRLDLSHIPDGGISPTYQYA